MLLFINGCCRENSRTLELAQAVLAGKTDAITEVRLFEDGPDGLTAESLRMREEALMQKNFDHPLLKWAKQFAEADEVVLAAPYWDMLFPAKVRAYLELVCAVGLTFHYLENGQPEGLCRAKRLTYVTTAGGPIVCNHGYEYVKTLVESFFGIRDVRLVKAEGLDMWGADAKGILEKAKQEISPV